MYVPDQVNFHMSQSCASSHTVQAYSGRKSYMKELERSVSVSGKNCIYYKNYSYYFTNAHTVLILYTL